VEFNWLRAEQWRAPLKTATNLHVHHLPLLKILGARPCRIYSQQRGVAPKYTTDVRKFHLQNIHRQGYKNPGHQFATTTPFCAAVPDVGGSTTWNRLHVSLLAVAPTQLHNLCALYQSHNRATFFLNTQIPEFCTSASEYDKKTGDWRRQCTHTNTTALPQPVTNQTPPQHKTCTRVTGNLLKYQCPTISACQLLPT
jgi:hypothetical protein